MSINHYSNSDLSHPSQWWSHYSSSPPPNHTLHLSPAADDEDRRREPEPEIPKEHLFEKALTPSDVGKLNRLVIPKQHAERHFPMSGAYAAEPGENGLLLGFEDENGKSWRFRYSYWNSSQSYVLTKGWSRFVKEKKLDAGDVVVFTRHRVDSARFFIGWRRRADGEASRPARAFTNPGYPYPCQHGSGPSASHSYQPEQRKPKWLRLFGVNLECQNTGDDESDSSTPTGYYYPDNQMDISFSGGGDVYRQG